MLIATSNKAALDQMINRFITTSSVLHLDFSIADRGVR
jgi:hypothetical protein